MADLPGGDAAASGYATLLTDLPDSLAALVLARLRDPVDVASALCSCRLFWSLAQAVPFQLCVNAGSWTPLIISWLHRHLLSTRKLDLAGCPILDKDVAELVASLPCLDCLVLDNCQKLTSEVSEVLFVSQKCGPRTVSLQRCFRLTPVAAGNLLVTVASDGSRLQALFFSHLEGLYFPPTLSSHDAQKWGCNIGAGLQVLALINCNNLGALELDAVATACPSLKFLMLGGSTARLGLVKFEYPPEDKAAAASEVLSIVVENIRGLLVLEVTFFSTAVTQAVRSNVRQGVHVWDFSEGKSITEAAALLARCKGSASFAARILSSRADTSWSATKSGPQDLGAVGGLFTADLVIGGPSQMGQTAAVHDVALALRAAANCADWRKRTPLHLSALSGDDQMIADLIYIGASVSGKKDRGGATALFYAAEYGHAGACALLLKSGAELFSQNRGGESPFYIAALMGHQKVVQVMIAHCSEQHANWEDASLYCDGWTPLMAAAVANHQDVGKVLLAAIGAPSPLLDAQNRYGLTALHIAARKPSFWFVEYLLKAGACLDIVDNDGKKPLDLARQFGHASVMNLLECGARRRVKAQPKLLQDKESSISVSRKQRSSRQRWVQKTAS